MESFETPQGNSSPSTHTSSVLNKELKAALLVCLLFFPVYVWFKSVLESRARVSMQEKIFTLEEKAAILESLSRTSREEAGGVELSREEKLKILNSLNSSTNTDEVVE
jgi:hypothetical protein